MSCPALRKTTRTPLRFGMLVVIILFVSALLSSGCGQSMRSTDGGAASTHGTPSPVAPARELVRLTHVAAVPPGQGGNGITLLVADPSGAGAWFEDNDGATADALYHASPTGKLDVYPVSNLGGQARDGLAVSRSGMVWFGVNTTLIRLDSHTGQIQQWTIPPGRDNPRVASPTARVVSGSHAVDALAVGPSGEVAIVMSNASTAEKFDPVTQMFSSLALPSASYEALSVTYTSDGSLCIGMFNTATGGHANELLLVRLDGATARTTVPDGTAWEVAPYNASTFIVGSFSPHLVSSTGAVTKVEAPAALHGSAGAPTPLQLLPDGNLVGIASGALIEFPSQASSMAAATAKASLLVSPEVPCTHGTMSDGGTIPDPTPTPFPTGAMCPGPMSDVLSVDGAGDLWVVSPYVEGVAILPTKTAR